MKAIQILGGRKLDGKIKIESAKNSVLALLSASILTKEEVVIENCPKIQDVISMLEILAYLGVNSRFENDNLIVNAKTLKGYCVPEKYTKKLRASIYFMGALCGVVGRSKISLPGGCDIGDRPIDLHISSLEQIGCNVSVDDNQTICQRVKNKDAEILLKFPSVGATINVILASALGKNKTIINNVAKEPEIVDLANFINSMGGKIVGAGTSRLEIQGVKRLHGTEYKPIPDRIEFGTYLLATAITCGKTQFDNVNLKNVDILVNKILNNSCHIYKKNDIIYTKFENLGGARSFATGPYPDFPTDLQPQTTAYLSVCDGCSVVKETLFEKRFSFVTELSKMGADIKIKDNVAFINGVKNLYGKRVVATDLRGGASLLIAGLKAQGQTVVQGVEHIERGYYNIHDKLLNLGADIKLIT